MHPDHKEPYQSWLKWLCQMLPGANQAVLIIKGNPTEADITVQWPKGADIRDDVISAAELSATQQQNVSTTLASQTSNGQIKDIVIAQPVKAGNSFKATLAVCVSIKPIQQQVVMQLIQWGELSLALLLKQGNSNKVTSDEITSNKPSASWFSAPVFTHSKLLFLIVISILFVMSFLLGEYRITAPASLEGKIQLAIVAPFDGYVSSANAKAGDTVSTGDTIAALDKQDLLLQKRQHEAEKNEYDRQYRQALAQRDKAKAHIFKSQISQADSQISLLEQKIQRSSLQSPLDGVIISGDLSRSLGTTVKTGDVLFEVAPLNEYRLIILVDEQEVVDVQPGLTGILNLKALQNEELAFTVFKVSPVFEENARGIAYRVEAKLEKQLSSLRPGMQGIAKITIGQRKLGWIYLHELYDSIRLWLWSWLP